MPSVQKTSTLMSYEPYMKVTVFWTPGKLEDEDGTLQVDVWNTFYLPSQKCIVIQNVLWISTNGMLFFNLPS